MEIRNLRTFLKVAALGNFTHAARELGYSQSNVSAHIKQLEEEIGEPLFNRVGHKVTLTQYGESLLPHARQMCAIAAKIETIGKTEASLTGTVKVGLTDSLSELALEDAYLAFHRQFPMVRLEISLDTTAKLLSRLAHGELDAACVITDPLFDPQWHIYSEFPVPIVIAANPQLPITEKTEISLEDLSAYELILTEQLSPYSLGFEQQMAQHHLACEPVIRVESTAAACRLTENGAFISVLPFYAVKEAASEGKVRILSVHQFRHQQVIQTVLHQSMAVTPPMEGFLKIFSEKIKTSLTIAAPEEAV